MLESVIWSALAVAISVAGGGGALVPEYFCEEHHVPWVFDSKISTLPRDSASAAEFARRLVEMRALTEDTTGADSIPADGSEIPHLKALVARSGRIDRSWLERTLKGVLRIRAGDREAVAERNRRIITALDSLGAREHLAALLDSKDTSDPTGVRNPSSVLWADLAGFELVEHLCVELGIEWPFHRSLIALVERHWHPTDDLAPVDDSWTNYLRSKLGQDDAAFHDMRPFTYDYNLPVAAIREARVWFSVAYPSPSYIIEANLNGHRLVLRSRRGTPNATEIWILAKSQDVRGGYPRRRDRVGLLCLPDVGGNRRYIGRDVPFEWLRSGTGRLTVTQWDLPGSQLPLEPPRLWDKVLSVQLESGTSVSDGGSH